MSEHEEYKKPTIEWNSNYQSDPEDSVFVSTEQHMDRLIAVSNIRHQTRERSKSEGNDMCDTLSDSESIESFDNNFSGNETDRSVRSLLKQWFDPLEKPLKIHELEKLRDDLISHLNEINNSIKTLKKFPVPPVIRCNETILKF